MDKINMGPDAFVFPNPVALLGAVVKDRANFMAIGWVSRVNAKPPLMGVSVHKSHHTGKGIRETKTFSVNFPRAEMVEVVDYCGIFSGKKVDKSQLFDIFYGELATAPMVVKCPLCMECRLVNVVDFPTNMFFVGEIVASYTEEKYLTKGKLDITKMNPLVLTMTDKSYWRIGDFVARAWHTGKGLAGK
jgi:flavin reductase (DIM6/NTAB) family NADH-FMN oxidoreductase RutF